MKNTTRILQICDSVSRGSGVAHVIFNWHTQIDTTKVQFDYLTFFPLSGNDLDEKIVKLGGKVYELPHPFRSPVKFLRESYRFFKTHRYQTIHSHITHLNFLFYPLAKMFGAKNIIQHTHTAKWGITRKSAVRNCLLVHAVWPLITHKLACSAVAGEAFYGKNFRIVKNGINTEKFAYNPQVRAQKRQALGLENAFVLGHVGRFSPEKNHQFLLDVLAEVAIKDPTARLVLVGTGPLEQKIKDSALQKGLQDKVVFLGVRKDVNELYQAFDVFIFPSLQEGFGLVAIEAQTAGLPCVLADTLPKEVLVCNFNTLPLHNAPLWADKIVALKVIARSDCAQKIKEAGFSARDIALSMQKFYLEMGK